MSRYSLSNVTSSSSYRRATVWVTTLLAAVTLIVGALANSANATDDEIGPDIQSLTVTPASAGPGDTVTISMAVADETGVQSVGFYMVVDGTQNDICGQSTSRVSGDALSGTWEKVCTIPDLVVNGTYVVTPFANDVLGRWTNMNGQNPIALTTELTITDTPTTTVTPTTTMAPTTVATTTTMAPTDPPSRATIDALDEGTVLVSSDRVGPTLTPGDAVDVRVGGFTPDEEVQIVVASTPRLLATVLADSEGYVSVRVSLPSDLAEGRHTLAVVSRESGKGVRQPVTVERADDSRQLPSTGMPIPVWPLVLVAIGTVALRIRRRM